jgi:phage-related protein
MTDSTPEAADLEKTDKALTSVSKATEETSSKFATLGKVAKSISSALPNDALGKTVGFLKDSVEKAAANSDQGARLADVMSRLRGVYDDFQIAVGKRLLPVVIAFGDWLLNTGVPAIRFMITSITSGLTPVVDRLRTGFEHLQPVLTKVEDFLRKNPSTVKTFAIALAALVSGVVAVTAAMAVFDAIAAANPVGAIVIGLAALAAGFQYAWTHSQTFRKVVTGVFDGVRDEIKGTVNAGKSIVNFFAKTLPNAAQSTIRWVRNHWSQLTSILSAPIAGAANAIKGSWNKIKTGATTVFNTVKGIPGRLAGLAKSFATAGGKLVDSVFSGIKNAAKAGAGFAADLLGDVKNAINSALHLPLQISLDKGPIHIHATVIPALASGGIVSSPTLALIGEAGPEAVVPLSGSHGAAARTALGTGGVTVNVYASNLVDPQTMARKIQTELVRLKRVGGGQLLGLA